MKTTNHIKIHFTSTLLFILQNVAVQYCLIYRGKVMPAFKQLTNYLVSFTLPFFTLSTIADDKGYHPKLISKNTTPIVKNQPNLQARRANIEF